MGMTVIITLSEPPWSVNGMYLNRRPGAGGRGRIKAPGYRMWREHMGWEIKEQTRAQFTGRVSVSITLPNKLRGDADNRIKSTLDLLQAAGVVANDRQCDPVSCGRGNVTLTTIEIKEVSK